MTVAISSRTPVLDEVILPSRGLLYEGRIPDGRVAVGPVHTRDEKVLADAGRISVISRYYLGRGLVLPGGFQARDLTIGDRLYVLFVIRAKSYGDDYDFEWRCPRCRRMNQAAIKISEIPMRVLADGVKEPFDLILPSSEHIVQFRLPRGHDEDALEQWQQAQDGQAPAQIQPPPGITYASQGAMMQFAQMAQAQDTQLTQRQVLFGRILRSLDSREFDYRNPRDLQEAQQFIGSLIPMDSDAIQYALEDVDPGLDLERSVECQGGGCLASTRITIPVGPEFFRSSRRRR